MPSGPSTAARTPFVLLVVVLLGGGLITLLLLNSALNQGSFKLRDLKNRTTELTDQEQALQRDVDDHSAPDALERRARELGMVPGGSPAFLDPDGTVRGEPSKAAVFEPDPAPTEPPIPPAAPPVAPPAVPPVSSSAPPPLDPPIDETAGGTLQDTPETPAATATTAPAPTTSGR
ncbi:cell division protein FtsL [Streptomyces sp. ISL-36]|uniref:FtsB family cell division protein n=1 Tax=Streptomyces sp. ISL-36 TaxID=2819182 RepID=UPI001BEB3A55|nr:septum formation initiator family protein [Streptomyces sp. ISL-36]MBT2440422.1 cell division protein FtsL [Streptomyces sp. ISL-36]